VATAVGGIPSFLTDGETALLVPPGNVAALSRAIERILFDEDLRRRLGRNGRALVGEHTLEATRERMMEVLRNEVIKTRA
jgi:glycosyltransferase involved in cell wall biosynthesis